ncbi:hypothetical protein GCM10008015_06290 [Flavobacterium palustre]|uniref:DUF1129 domain-containing protein n=1 Tax=Flavobacterium palustre TaxID=1476463 RepID=A0ABQ1HBH5_9FLAO|nr:hypothetical protein [Flavobacterium palustre]GGA68233.1 hypothetical protein GCM10008015_06290 [Flavobacterium palustre]
MKLTNEQIAIIDQTLIDKGVVYEEIKLELLDHIVTDIELETEESNFDVAFSKAMLKWERELEEINPSGKFAAPRIVMEKFSSFFKGQYKFLFPAAAIFSFLIAIITTLYPEEFVYNTVKLVFYSVYFLFCFGGIISLFFISKTKSKTISGKLIQKSWWFLVLQFCVIYVYSSSYSRLYRHYNNEPFLGKFIEWLMPFYFFLNAFHLIMIAIEHFRTVRKYKLV